MSETPVSPDSVEARLLAAIGPASEIETELLERQQALVEELAQIEADLRRIAAVRTAIAGGDGAPRRGRPKSTSGPSGSAPRAPRAERRDALIKGAREIGGVWTIGDLADHLGLGKESLRANVYALVEEGTFAEVTANHGITPATYRLA